MTEEIYKRRRPKTFKAMFGQEEAIEQLKEFDRKKNYPHTILFTGPSGVGKTTLARIVANKLGCKGLDLTEMNCATDRGIDTIREIERTVNLFPMESKVRYYIVDEVHQWTPQAQDAVLKILEDTPQHGYFALCTTDPQKLKKTIITRSTVIKLSLLSSATLCELVSTIARKEKTKLADDVVERIADAAEGSARKALVILNAVIGIKKEEKQLRIIDSFDLEKKAENLVRMLLRGRGAKWNEIAKELKTIEDEPETVRRKVLGYCAAILLSGKPDPLAAFIIEEFSDPFYDSGKAGLVRACWRTVEGFKT